jgi:hypothetical protein
VHTRNVDRAAQREREIRTNIKQFLVPGLSPRIQSTRKARQVEANNGPDAVYQRKLSDK